MADARPASELTKRVITAIVMLLVSGTALWLGGIAWTVFVLIIGIGVWFEWSALCLLIFAPGGKRTAWRCGGAVYCGIACAALMALRDLPIGMFWVLLIAGTVIATDVGAYAFGRLIGGPKIAPSISPSKTWAGLVGGMAASALVSAYLISRLADQGFVSAMSSAPTALEDTYVVVAAPFGGIAAFALVGALIAIVAQAGDFFESWMKRRAGVKDSGRSLPGHGGLFDRVDGLLLVLFVFGNLILISQLAGGV